MHQAKMFIQSALLRFMSDSAEQTNKEELDEQATPKATPKVKVKGIQWDALLSWQAFWPVLFWKKELKRWQVQV